jgi:phage tail sheath protein FI
VRDFFEQGGRRAIVVRAHLSMEGDTASLTLGRGRSRLILEATGPGAWGRGLTARIDPLRGNSRFDLTVTDTGTGLVEVFAGVSLAAGSPSRVDRALEASALVRARLPLPTTLPPAASVTATGGSDGRFGTAAYTGPGMREAGRGIYALDLADRVDLIVLPPYSTRTGVPRRVVADTVAYAAERRAMVILDPPVTWQTVEDAAAGAAGYFPTRDAALYFPRIRRPDSLRSGNLRDFAPSGAVAGMLARHDFEQGVWRSPVGSLRGATPSIQLSKANVERLGPLGINCIRVIQGKGTMVWGARTRAADPEWKYVNVRRLALYIEESVYRGLQWAAFEPNDQALWTRVRAQIESFLITLWRQGAFPANKPEEAFFVRCGPDTMTQDDIDNGRLNVMVGIAPVRPAEFVLIRIGQWVSKEDP